MMLQYLLVILSAISIANGANILFFFGVSTYSHRITVWPLAEKLALNHSVTFVQPFKPKVPNPKITEFFPQELAAVGGEFEKMNFLNIRLKTGREGTQALASELPKHGLHLCEQFLKSKETQQWIKNSKFDLVVIDGLLNDCGVGLAKKFNAKFIIYGTTHPFAWWNDIFGFPVESSWIPELHVSFQYPMNLWQRLVSTLLPISMYLERVYSYYPKLDEIFRKYLDPNMPSIAELEKNTSLIFTNTHFSEELSRSLPPLVVPIGGLHCEDHSQKLSKELEKFVNDSGDQGFIYISFGSAAKISQAPKEFQDLFFNALSKTKSRIIWKYESDRPAGMSSNVFTDKWMPQQAILSHPKIKAFFTHGGLLGMQEAVTHGVPLIVLPLFAEQDYNAFRVERTERGILLDAQTLTTEKILDAFHQITTDTKYKKNMQTTSRLFKDRPQNPLDLAVWWTHYVLRNDDLSSLKPLGMNQSWFERRVLDVWACLFTVLLVLILIVFTIVKKILCAICCSKSKTKIVSKSSGSKSKVKKN